MHHAKKTELTALGFRSNPKKAQATPHESCRFNLWFPDPTKAFRVGLRSIPKPKSPPINRAGFFFGSLTRLRHSGWVVDQTKAQEPQHPPMNRAGFFSACLTRLRAFRVGCRSNPKPKPPPPPHESWWFLPWFPNPTKAFRAPSRSKPQTLAAIKGSFWKPTRSHDPEPKQHPWCL